ncbi:MAG: ATP phosphoribosyltransferase regulatory subunit [Lachnospiraceae bacterium]|nr:ATP phosphoribosyltransferase regulatory subunit [Lachnospiraceae bacterium]
MENRLLHTPEGVRDIYNSECERKQVIENKLFNVLKQYGYQAIETPTFEYFDVFSREIGTTASKELFKFFDREGNTLVMRPDFTPSIARSAAKYYHDEDMPVRFGYMGNTFINHLSLQGRLKETTHLGAELIGDDSVDADAEIVALMIRCLKSAGLKEFQVSIGHMDFFKGLIKAADLEEDTEYELRELISNKNHFGIEELLAEHEISEDIKLCLMKTPELFGSIQMLEEAKKMVKNPQSLSALERLEAVYEALKAYGVEDYITFDLGMVSKYKYYTGVILKAYTYGVGEALITGGRYDTLLNHFGKDSAAIGCVLVVNQLLAALSRQKIQVETEHDKVLLVYETETRIEAVEKATVMRNEGRKVTMLLKKKEWSKEDCLSYARRNHFASIISMDKDGTGKEELV